MTKTEQRRVKLSKTLHNILGSDNVYFDPPESVKMKYPAIVYSREKINTSNANNHKYFIYDRYEVTFIRKDPDHEILDALLEMPFTEHIRDFTSQDLYHDVFTVYVY